MMHHQKRRKKRLSHGVKTVELSRGKYGYGFTISGQQPCVLSCIVTGSPAEQVGLKPGDFLLGVNLEDVSRAPHDDVVRLIGSSTGLLTLQIAENVNGSDSSDEEYHLNKPKSKYPNRYRHRHDKNTSGNRAEKVLADLQSGAIFHDRVPSGKSGRRTGADRSRTKSPAVVALTAEPPPHPGVNSFFDENDGASSRRTKSGQVRPRVVSPLQDNTNREKTNQKHATPGVSNVSAHVQPPSHKWDGQANKSGLPVYRDPPPYRSSSPYEVVLTSKDIPNILCPTLPPFVNKDAARNLPRDAGNVEISLRVVVGYIGSIEIPSNFSKPNSHVQIIRNAIRRLRVEQKVHTLVLMEVFVECVTLKNATGTTIATYPAEKVAYSGACPDDKRFFGIVTVTSVSSDEVGGDNGSNYLDHVQSSSCHVFMVDPDLRPHSVHGAKAKSFSIECTFDPETRNCVEFPRSSTAILKVLCKLYKDRFGSWLEQAAQQNILGDNVGQRLSISNSSNSDSGLGIPRDDGSVNDRVFVVDLDASRNAGASHPRPNSRPRPGSAPQDLQANEVNHSRQSSLANCPDLPPTGRTSRMAHHESMHDDLESVSSADSIRRSMHKIYHRSKNNYADNSDTESVRSDSSFMISSRVAKLLERPMSVPLSTHGNDQSFVKPSRPAELNQSFAVETIDLADKLSPRAFIHTMPKKAGSPARSIGQHFGDDSPSAFKKPTTPTAFRPWKTADSAEKLKSPISYSHESLVPSEHNVHNTSYLAPASSLDSVADKSMKEQVEIPLTVSASWAVNLCKLLHDGLGLAALMEFLKKEFSQENLQFWITCEKFKRIQDKDKQKLMAKEIFDKHIAPRAPEPVNIDSQARKMAEQGLNNISADMFEVAQSQIFQLMKHDCYPRFLKSDLYKKYVVMEMANQPLPLVAIEIEERPPASVRFGTLDKKKSRKIKLFDDGQEEKRRKSFLPWHKNKSRKLTKEDSGKKSSKPSKLQEPGIDVSSAKRSLKMSASSGAIQKESERSKSTPPSITDKANMSLMETVDGPSSIIKVVLPDGSTSTILPSSGQTVKSAVSKLCEKKGITTVSIDVYPLGSEKALDLNADITNLGCKEIVIERRVLFRMDLPNRKCIGIKAKPKRSLEDVVKPILQKYGFKMENIVVHMPNSPAIVSLDTEVSSLDNQRVVCQSREDFADKHWWIEWGGFDGRASSKPPLPQRTSVQKNDLDEITTKIFDDLFVKVNSGPHWFDELGILDPDRKDEEKAKTNEGRTSSGLFGFIRRNSIEKDRSKVKSRPSIGTQKNLPSKLAKLRIQDADNDKFFELLSRAQSQRLDDQRGLSSDRFELPDFLKTDQPNGNKLKKGNFKTTSASDMFGMASQGQENGLSLFRSQSHPEGLESDIDEVKPLGYDLKQLRCVTPGRDQIAFIDDSFSQDYVMPSHMEAENMFAVNNSFGHSASTPDFLNPNLMKKSIRDLGFNYSITEDNQGYTKTDKSRNISNNFGVVTPIRPKTPLDKKLSPRATLPASAFENTSPNDERTVFDQSNSLNLTVIAGESVADISVVSQLPPPPDNLEMNISQMTEADYPPPPPLPNPRRRDTNSSAGSSADNTFTGTKSPLYAVYSVPKNEDHRRSPYMRQYPKPEARSRSCDRGMPSQFRRSTPTVSTNETTMTLSPMNTEINTPVAPSIKLGHHKQPPPIPEKPKGAYMYKKTEHLNNSPKVHIEIMSPSPPTVETADLPSPTTHLLLVPGQSIGSTPELLRDRDKRRVSFEEPEVQKDVLITFV